MDAELDCCAMRAPAQRVSRRLPPVGLLLGSLAVGAAACAAQSPADGASGDGGSERARMIELLRGAPLIDGHNDVPWQLRERFDNRLEGFAFDDTTRLRPPMHTDLRRLERSGLGGIFWSVYTPSSTGGPGALRTVLEQIDVAVRLLERHPDHFELAHTADEVERIAASGRIAALLGMEGGHGIDGSLAALRQLHRLGVRYMTLTHPENTARADSATALPQWNGLTDFGREVVAEMNRVGMLVDLSHVSPKTMHDALDVSQAPVIFSHSSVHSVTPHPRNVPDDVLERLPRNGGVVMITFVPPFVSESSREYSLRYEIERGRLQAAGESGEVLERSMRAWVQQHRPPRASLVDVADHIDALREKIGIPHIGIGSDFDGIDDVPDGLEDVSKLPDLFLELRRRGYSDDDLRAIAGGNVLRAMRSAEEVSSRLAGEPPTADTPAPTAGEGSR